MAEGTNISYITVLQQYSNAVCKDYPMLFSHATSGFLWYSINSKNVD